MTRTETAIVNAKALLAARSTKDLISDFELTNILPCTRELYDVRGWIMDELEKRNFSAFAEWIDSTEESPRKFFLKRR